MKRSTWVAAVAVGLAGALGGCFNFEDTCEPEGEVFVRAFQIGTIALDEESVYWTAMAEPGQPRRGEIWRTAKSGGEPERLYQTAEDPFSTFSQLRVDATHVYWLEPCIGQPVTNPPCAEVRRVPKTGGTFQSLVRDRVFAFAVDGDRLYYTTSNEGRRPEAPPGPPDNGAVWSMPKDGSGPPAALVSNLVTLRQLVLDDTSVYFVANQGTPPGVVGSDKAWVSRVPKTGGTVEPVVVTFSYMDSFVLTDEWLVYFHDKNLSKVPRDGTQPTRLNPPAENKVDSFAVAGDTVYFADPGRSESGGGFDGEGSRYICGAIRSMSLSGGESKPLFEDQARPHSLQLDGSMLYWVSSESDFRSVTIRRSRL